MKIQIPAFIRKFQLPFSLFCVGFFLLFFMIQNHNHRFGLCDFYVYYHAAQNMLAGLPIYHIAFGEASGFYKYSPFALFAFVPISLLPSFAAQTLFFVFLSFVIYKTILEIGWFSCLISGKRISAVFPYLVLLVGGAHFYRELSLGNINSVLILGCLLSGKLLLQNHRFAPGIIIGAVILFKMGWNILR